jgi:hypothetical protein
MNLTNFLVVIVSSFILNSIVIAEERVNIGNTGR